MPVKQTALRNIALVLVSVPALALTACGGEGSGDMVATPYHSVPYTEGRTAGSGIAFVRASMLPSKEAKTETIMEQKTPVAAPVETPPPPVDMPVSAPVSTGDKVFDKKQTK